MSGRKSHEFREIFFHELLTSLLLNEIRKIEEIIRVGLEPAISGIYLKAVHYEHDQHILVVNIPKSWSAPHRVKRSIDKDHKFFGRNSRGKYELSYLEIRNQFMLGGSVRDKIKNFREERINAIKAGDLPIQFECNGPKIVLHIVPFSAYDSNVEYNLQQIRKLYQASASNEWFNPLGQVASTQSETTLQGFLTYYRGRKVGYAHFHREGIIEAVSLLLPLGEQDELLIHSSAYENFLLKQKYLNILQNLNVAPSFCMFLSLVGVAGYSLAVSSGMGFTGAWERSTRRYGKNEILLKEVISESFDDSLAALLRPSFDRFCNAWGFDACPHYGEDGAYRAR